MYAIPVQGRDGAADKRVATRARLVGRYPGWLSSAPALRVSAAPTICENVFFDRAPANGLLSCG